MKSLERNIHGHRASETLIQFTLKVLYVFGVYVFCEYLHYFNKILINSSDLVHRSLPYVSFFGKLEFFFYIYKFLYACHYRLHSELKWLNGNKGRLPFSVHQSSLGLLQNYIYLS